MDKSPSNNRLLRYALLCSVAFHALLLSVFADFSRLTVSNDRQVRQVIAAQLHPPHLVATEVSDIAARSAQAVRPMAVSRVGSRPEKVLSIQSARRFSLSAPGLHAPAQLASDSSAESGAPPSKVDAPSPEAPDANDLRTYRLNLSREARRYKRYPAMARERGLEGVVVVVVSAGIGIAIPQVSLSQGSGEAVLDHQALEMVSLAVRYAKMPDSLQQQGFGIDLPIHFSLDE